MVYTPPGQKAISNELWVTDTEIPDPTPLPLALGWRIVIRPVAVKTKSKGGVFLPETFVSDVQSLTTVGRVLAVGPMAFTDPDMGPYPWYAVGDYVTFAKYAGTKFLYKGVRLVVMNDDEPILKIEDPAALDPLFSLNH